MEFLAICQILKYHEIFQFQLIYYIFFLFIFVFIEIKIKLFHLTCKKHWSEILQFFQLFISKIFVFLFFWNICLGNHGNMCIAPTEKLQIEADVKSFKLTCQLLGIDNCPFWNNFFNVNVFFPIFCLGMSGGPP